jgi:hypothetical protein
VHLQAAHPAGAPAVPVRILQTSTPGDQSDGRVIAARATSAADAPIPSVHRGHADVKQEVLNRYGDDTDTIAATARYFRTGP